jgi:hypothetical protein
MLAATAPPTHMQAKLAAPAAAADCAAAQSVLLWHCPNVNVTGTASNWCGAVPYHCILSSVHAPAQVCPSVPHRARWHPVACLIGAVLTDQLRYQHCVHAVMPHRRPGSLAEPASATGTRQWPSPIHKRDQSACTTVTAGARTLGAGMPARRYLRVRASKRACKKCRLSLLSTVAGRRVSQWRSPPAPAPAPA